MVSLEHGFPAYFVSLSTIPTNRLSKVITHPYFLGTEGMFKRYGRHIRVVGPGLHYVNPCTDTLTTIDMRITVLDLDRQSIMTKDNVTISIDTSVYYQILNSRYAAYRV